MSENESVSEEASRLALLALEEQRHLLAEIDVIVWKMDPSTLALSYVTGALAHLGYPIRVWTETPDFFARVLHPNERATTIALIRAVAADGQERQVVHRLLRAGTGERWFRTHVRARRGGDGRVRELLGVMLDISERVTTESELRENQAHLQRLLDQLPALVWTTDRDLRFTFGVGRELSDLGIHNPNALTGVSIQEYFAIVDPADPRLAPYRRALEGEPGRVDEDWMGRSYQTHLEPFRDAEGKITGILGVSWNVTERKRAEDRLRLLAEASAVAAESLDSEQTLRKVARLTVGALADWCVISVVEDQLLRAVTVAHVEPDKEAIFRALLPAGVTTLGSIVPLLRRGARSTLLPRVTDEMIQPGTEFPLPEGEVGMQAAEAARRVGVRSLIVTPLVARKQTLGVMAFGRGSPDSPFDEKDLGVAEELARRCAVAIDNAQLYRAAQAAIDARDEFLSVASHELRTPLTSIQLRLEALERAVHGGRPVQLVGSQGALSIVLRQFKRLAGLVEQLLDVSRVRRGPLDLVREDVDLAQVTRDVAARFEADLAHGGGALSISAPAPAVGRWDRVRIEQVVTDLLSNSAKFARGTVIEIEVTADERSARLLVRDRGMGISDADQARIFQRFERAASSRHFGGLGLGLYITRQIVEAHGGTIRLTSALGQGTTVVVDLPRAQPQAISIPGRAYP